MRLLESRRAEIFALISAACFVNGFLSREREDETNSLECLAHIFAQLAAVTDIALFDLQGFNPRAKLEGKQFNVKYMGGNKSFYPLCKFKCRVESTIIYKTTIVNYS